jgi:hypothetical protein
MRKRQGFLQRRMLISDPHVLDHFKHSYIVVCDVIGWRTFDIVWRVSEGFIDFGASVFCLGKLLCGG